MKDLIVEYEYGLAALRKKDQLLKREQDSIMDKRLKQLHTIEDIERLAVIESDRNLISGMISEMQDDIQHMKTGRRPGNKRGAENLAAYQREISIDPGRFLHIANTEEDIKSEEEVKLLEGAIEELLWFLSKREKDLYILFAGYNFSVQEIADLTGLTEGTIYQVLDRARKKIRKNIKIDDFFS